VNCGDLRMNLSDDVVLTIKKYFVINYVFFPSVLLLKVQVTVLCLGDAR